MILLPDHLTDGCPRESYRGTADEKRKRGKPLSGSSVLGQVRVLSQVTYLHGFTLTTRTRKQEAASVEFEGGGQRDSTLLGDCDAKDTAHTQNTNYL